VSRTFRVRLGQSTDQQLVQLCEAVQLRTSTAIRICIEYVLAHPEAWDVFRRGAPYLLTDPRSEAQKANWAAYEEEAARFNMNDVARELGYP
jgi:hypothetical protein